MASKQSMETALALEQTAVQVQRLSAQQMTFVRVLEKSGDDLKSDIERELEENAALEKADAGADDVPAETADGDDAYEEDAGLQEDGVGPAPEEKNDLWDNFGSDDDDAYYSDYAPEEQGTGYQLREQESFMDELLAQADELDLNDTEHQVMEFLIGSLDNDGLLRDPNNNGAPLESWKVAQLLSINNNVDVDEETVERMVRKLQTFEPVGVGGRSLQECLLIQLRRKPRQTPEVQTAQRIVERYYDDFRNKRMDRLKQACNLDEEGLQRVWEVLTHLNPQPGRSLNETAVAVAPPKLPDFIVRANDKGGFDVELTRGDVPTLYVSPAYKASLQELKGNRKELTQEQKNQKELIESGINRAMMYINALQQRQDTLLKTMRTIVMLQPAYFETGDREQLVPMKLEDVARITLMDVSTVSRATKDKYADTDFGLVALKSLFTQSVKTASGEELSRDKVKNRIQELIDGEDKRHPLSDIELTALLNKEGLAVARRTVVKYRMRMNIPTARLRRQ
ncbi:MAG: RNA polymerase factor sigma-54 [Bacteroidaceae bacterium]|nr:RNA polymerase factor sigma-54 [Bacteroidaceae bacterium]